MLTHATQDTRHLNVFTALGANRLLLRRFTGREAISQLSHFSLELLADHSPVDAADLVGTAITFLVDRENQQPRYFSGYVADFAYAGETELAVTYRATVVPWLWFLTQTSDCRIFQQQTVPQILERVFRDQGFEDFNFSRVRGDYATREYCVQYRETDFNFVSRLMEEEGIYYFFQHTNGQHQLILADSIAAYSPIEDPELEFPAPYQTDSHGDAITEWEHQIEFRPGHWTQNDFDFRKPSTSLLAERPAALPGQTNTSFEVYDYPGGYAETDVGRSRTRVRMEEYEVPHDSVRGVATYRSLTPGRTFSIRTHRSADEVGSQYLLSAVEYEAGVSGSYISGSAIEELTYVSRFAAIPSSVPFRPERRAPRPVMEGPQTAMVVGPAGEEIYTDEYARVKCQFHWDREGEHDEESSCWIRVSQEHAGAGWGTIDLPRIGEEVIVSFLEGNPDRPIIKGRVYNGDTMPPFGLQGADNAKNKTRSGGKTTTYKGSGFNEMTMDDTRGKEQLRVNAQHNLDANVNNNQTLQIGLNKSEDVGNNDDLAVAVDSTTDVGNDQSTTVGNNSDVIVGNNVVIEAGTAITLACGGSTIHMNQAGVITISGNLVTSAATAANSIVAPMTNITGASMLTQAAPICLDIGGVCHIKGTTAAVDAASVRVDGGMVVVKGAPIKLGEVGAPVLTLPSCGGGSGSSASTSAPAVSTGSAGGEGRAGSGKPGDSSSGSQQEQGPRTSDDRARPNQNPDGEKARVENEDQADAAREQSRDNNSRSSEGTPLSQPDQSPDNSSEAFPYDATEFGHAKKASEMSPQEYHKALEAAETYEEAVALAMDRQNNDPGKADGDIIDARERYYDRRNKELFGGRDKDLLTQDEIRQLHKPELVNADAFLEGYKQADRCGVPLASAKVEGYAILKSRSAPTSSTDNDGRAQSPPDIWDKNAGHAGVDRAWHDGRAGWLPNRPEECGEETASELLSALDDA